MMQSTALHEARKGVPRLLAALLAVALAAPAAPAAAEELRGPSRVEVLGVDQFDTPRHRKGFSLIQFTPDPIERFNRGSLAVTKPILHWVIRPLAKGWRAITPAGMRRSIDKFAYNLAWPNRFVALLLQGRPGDAATETGRFLLNTTVGIVGFFDPATAAGVPTHEEDVGLAFASWGAGPGFYFFIPLMGPSTGRDAVGRVFDTVLNPATFVPGLSWFFNTNSFTFRVDTYENLVETTRELYFPVRTLWLTQREVQVTRLSLSPEDYRDADPEPSLGVVLLETDPAFRRKGTVRQVVTAATGKQLAYSAWIQPEPGPIVYIVPGIGAHRNSQLPRFLAQKAFERGYSVGIVSNPFQSEFIQNGLSVPYPGYTPSDAADVYAALVAVDQDLEQRHSGRFTSRRLLGYSLGGIESLFIAAEQDGRGDGALRFERVVALNPPVRMRYAARQFDGYFDAPLRWPDGERQERVKRAVMKAYLLTQPGVSVRDGFPFDRTESEFLVGFYARVGLMEALAAIEQRGAPVLEIAPETDQKGRVLLGPVNQTTLDRYASELIVPFYEEKTGLEGDELERRASLPSQAAALRDDERIYVITNADDFILGEDGLEWLQSTLGDRLTVFPRGGHLGNLYLESVQNALFEALDGKSPTAVGD